MINFRASVIPLTLAAVSLLFAASSARAQSVPEPVHTPHAYTDYEKLILKNVSTFHVNYNNRNFAKNGDLVADDVFVLSNGVEVHGRDAFVQRIARFATPFPDVKLQDLNIVVDGNQAAVRFVITGTQKGDLVTPGGTIPATGKPIKIDGIEYFTFNKEGKLTYLITCENLSQMIQQLKASN